MGLLCLPRPLATACFLVNDVYNVAQGSSEPVGGAAGFVSAVQKELRIANTDTLVVFSGDAFSPAPLTNYTNGEEIPPVLNAAHVDIACIGRCFTE